MGKSNLKFHLLALFTILVWGTTFASTKVLLLHGLTPIEILFYRFLIAYLCIWLFIRKPLFANSLRDELLMFLLGVSGGTLYFLAENTALDVTYSSNVALIICITPLLSALLTIAVFKEEHFTWKLIMGSLLALSGVACIIINSNFVFEFSLLGDSLTLLASLSWAVYSVIMKVLNKRYSVLFLTRKVFFYGIVSVLPVSFFVDDCWHFNQLTTPVVFGNLLFLGVIASMFCFFSWNLVLSRLGVIKANNYMYTQPIVSLMCAAIILDEKITWIALSGGLLIIAGIYVAQHHKKKLPSR